VEIQDFDRRMAEIDIMVGLGMTEDTRETRERHERDTASQKWHGGVAKLGRLKEHMASTTECGKLNQLVHVNGKGRGDSSRTSILLNNLSTAYGGEGTIFARYLDMFLINMLQNASLYHYSRQYAQNYEIQSLNPNVCYEIHGQNTSTSKEKVGRYMKSVTKGKVTGKP